MTDDRVCAACGEPITETMSYTARGLRYHAHHLPTFPPGPEQVLRALHLIRSRAAGNAREEITLGDIEWAIQELEKG